jgi:hypothetical protein
MTHRVVTIWVDCCTDRTEMQWDRYLEDMQAIVTHAEAICAAEQVDDNREFAFEMEVLAPLYFTGLHCHHPPTRARVVAVLNRLRRREGTWFPRQLSRFIGRVAEIEEADVEVREDGEAWPREPVRIHDLYFQRRRDDHVLITFHSQPNGSESKGRLWDEWVKIGSSPGSMDEPGR